MGCIPWLQLPLHFYPRSPCGERRPSFCVLPSNAGISIHALLAESDGQNISLLDISSTFLSTLSLRRATVHYDNYNLHCVISIHALLAESDGAIGQLQCIPGNFYPRSPCGERPSIIRVRYYTYNISIHALLAESDHRRGIRRYLAT